MHSIRIINILIRAEKVASPVTALHIPANFNGFRVVAALLHGTLVVGVSQTAALNRGRHLYSAERPSRWALAHILVIIVIKIVITAYNLLVIIRYRDGVSNTVEENSSAFFLNQMSSLI